MALQIAPKVCPPRLRLPISNRVRRVHCEKRNDQANGTIIHGVRSCFLNMTSNRLRTQCKGLRFQHLRVPTGQGSL